ncbi:hypothetical protein QN277_021960 [Acacia crassicarpa]|uniref:Uncharacterized protein n=1 Tax=Acacia crassicarpa TaxID=499986 RepID=A0AAE1JRD2_9FABA|nr:hypothetical protein QN277_021960 [Acacia crassicarpa]
MAKRKICEVDDWCFECKDGGDLVVCDHEDCGKVYHKDCVREEDSSLEDGKPWICGRHYCFDCRKPSQFYCLGCPHAVCNKCYAVAEFVVFGGGKGLCCDCLELVFIIENNLDHDSEGNKINLNDRETVEALFKEYWDIIKLKEGLTSDDVCATLNKYKMDQNSLHHRRFSDTEEEEDEDEDSDDDDDDDDEDEEDEEEGCITHDTDNHKLGPKSNRSKSKEFIRWEPKFAQTKYKKDKISLHQRGFGECEEDLTSYISDINDTRKHKTRTKRKGSESQEFIGWGSKSVIAFLASIGKDIIEPLTRWAVTYLICEYVEEKHLHHPQSEKKFIPDEKLFPIFRRKVVPESKIYSLLKPHIAENLQQITEEKCDDKNMGSFTYKLPNDQQSLLTKSLLKKGDYITRMSCFASINAENIKLIYLKQSLVIELSKQLESFEDKVIGTFVRIQGDLTDHRQGNHCHLVRVIGVNEELLLQVSFMPKAIAISELSDYDFTEQECETLRQKVEENLLSKITVKELQAKATSLHEDITKHRIAKRLVYLEKRIEYANDKGRLREKDVLLDEKLELEQPGKMDELLRELPTVLPELYQQKYDPNDTWEPHEQAL